MARRYTKKQQKEMQRVVKHHWKALLVILALMVIMLAVLYYTGVLDKIIEKLNPSATPPQQEEPEGGGDSGDGGESAGGNGSLNAADFKNVTTTVDVLKDLEIAFIDVGQGDCIIIELPDGKNMIIDSGEYNDAKNAITAYTTANDITTFDYLLLTHQDSDHAGNMSWVIDNYEVKYIFRPNNEATHATYDAQLPDDFNYGDGYKSTSATYGKFMLSAYNENCIVEVFNKNSDFTNTVVYGDEDYQYTFNFLTPTLDVISYSDPNDYSPILMLEYAGKRIMFTGDAELDNLAEYVQAYGDDYNVDVLKVGHHGSSNATTLPFIQAIDPEYAIIQCGEGNSYGHPHKTVLDLFYNYDNNIDLYRTDNNGNILLTVDILGSIVFGMENTDVSDNFTPGSVEGSSALLVMDIVFDKRRVCVA
ncbi:MAG: MBL fold metallo-hydrolase [Clostridiales bacterium]|nr:MBL fold metallo-hydrolase [Clostridiales bacterium]